MAMLTNSASNFWFARCNSLVGEAKNVAVSSSGNNNGITVFADRAFLFSPPYALKLTHITTAATKNKHG